MDHAIASTSSASVTPETVTTKPGLSSGSKEIRSFDGVDDDIDLDYHGHLRSTQQDEGFTRLDAREMKRMGKKQELRVSMKEADELQSAHKVFRETFALCRPLLSPSSCKEHGKFC